jgi:hypothetical protein
MEERKTKMDKTDQPLKWREPLADFSAEDLPSGIIFLLDIKTAATDNVGFLLLFVCLFLCLRQDLTV